MTARKATAIVGIVVQPSAVVPEAARGQLLRWYRANGRTLPFRASRDPWAILVSEVLAQQTQAARAGQRWLQFMARFPTAADLAAATPADVLREWQGLGYNRRALALWRAARIVVADHGGRLPNDVAALERLPGVGPYTARAVAAIAFGRPVGAVDTNVRRVLTRLVGRVDASAREVQALADASVPSDAAADWTHAVMDVGALFCRPAAPRCADCPVAAWCRWAAGSGDRRPTAPRHRPTRPFPTTTRWLRGRILDRLRAADGWATLEGPIGSFDGDAVAVAVSALAREGLAEVDAADPMRARLPLG